METKFTPGPWHFISGVTYLSVQGDRAETILLDTSPEMDRERKEADYRLIAAAPDLLALALAVAEHFADTDAPLGTRARELIARVTGA